MINMINMINMIKITINVDLQPSPAPPAGYRDKMLTRYCRMSIVVAAWARVSCKNADI